MSKKTRKVSPDKPESNYLQSNAVIDFSFDTVWISIKHKKFTNFLANDDQYFKMHKIIFKDILPIVNTVQFVNVNEFIKQITYAGLRHSHEVGGSHKDLVIEIITSILISKGMNPAQAQDKVNQNIKEEKMYQIGHNSVRMFGYFKNNVFIVLVVDYHHLVYPSKDKHNEDDYMSYKVCPIDRRN